jgi:hypothetical protein
MEWKGAAAWYLKVVGRKWEMSVRVTEAEEKLLVLTSTQQRVTAAR